MSVPTVSVIISVFGQLQYTKRCLAQLEETLAGKLDYEVLIIDDASKDGTIEFLQDLGEGYRVFFNEENQGFAKNNNLGAKEARGEYLCFLNNRRFRSRGLASTHASGLRAKGEGWHGGWQKLAGSRRYDHMGVVFAPQGNPRHYGQGFLHHPFKGEVRKWSAVTAACCVASRERFLEFDGFDEVFLNGCEDIDLCLRMSEGGLIHFVVHDSVVDHVKCASEGRKIHNQRNTEILLDRWRDRLICGQVPKDRALYKKTLFWGFLVKPWSFKFFN